MTRKEKMLNNSFKTGISDGIPISLGYFSVSIGFGLMAVSKGIPPVVALLMSLTNLTSAGQVAGVDVIAGGGTYIEMAVAQLVINMRYALMSVSLSQKMHNSVSFLDRLWIAFGNTDEIFAVSSTKNGELGKRYMLGLMLMPIFGWSSGTILGAVAGKILPETVISALGIAIYGMFVAVFVPPMKKSSAVSIVVLLSIILSCTFAFVPSLSKVSGGFVIIICALIAATVGAIIKPVADEEEQEEQR